jgi:CelD/BcsL family acetyltransferase involved in cellulose biosynthesis
MIRTITEARDFDGLRRDWNAVLAASASDGIFLTWEWLRTWWTHLAGGRRLAITTVLRAGEPIAVAPFVVRPRYVARFQPLDVLEFQGTGLVGSDYLDIFARRGHEPQAVGALADRLCDGAASIELAQVRGAESLSAALAVELRKRGWSVVSTPRAVCPYIDLRGHSWDSYLASVGAAHRANFRRRLRRLERRYDLRFEQPQDEAGRKEAFEALVRLHLARRRSLGGSEAFYLPGLVRFHEEFSARALRRGWLRLLLLRLNGVPAAAFYGFRYGGTFYFYQSGFDPAFAGLGVGLVLMGLAIRTAIDEGASEFDFLHGDEPYKFLWTRLTRPLMRLRLYPPTAAAALYRGFHEARGGAAAAARRLRRLARETPA